MQKKRIVQRKLSNRSNNRTEIRSVKIRPGSYFYFFFFFFLKNDTRFWSLFLEFNCDRRGEKRSPIVSN